MPLYKKTIISGDVKEIEYYKSIRKRSTLSIKRGANVNRSTDKQVILNDIHARKQFQRLINANFSYKAKDMYITLTYDDDVSLDEAKHECNLFIRRLRHYRQSHKLTELKYIGVTEVGNKNGRVHHHIIINNIDYDTLAELWKHGRVKASRLDKHCDYTGLANYLSKQRNGGKRYFHSKNLKQPVIECEEVKRIKDFTSDKPPKNYTLVENKVYCSDVTGLMQYTRFVRMLN